MDIKLGFTEEEGIATAPYFNDDERHSLRTGKYTKWAENIDADSLYAVLWMVGEYCCRSTKEFPVGSGIFMPFRTEWEGQLEKMPNEAASSERREAALQQLVTLFHGIQCEPWTIKGRAFPSTEENSNKDDNA